MDPVNIIFVLGTDKKLYVAPHEVSRFHHSSFFAGQPVICGGELSTNSSGCLTEITDKSGHYKPRNHNVLFLLQHLAKQNIDLSTVTFVKKPKQLMSERINGEIVHYAGRWNAQEFLQKNGKAVPSDNIMQDYL